jgi:hypothetical protein
LWGYPVAGGPGRSERGYADFHLVGVNFAITVFCEQKPFSMR